MMHVQIRTMSVLITGSNRGVGLGLVKRFLQSNGVEYVFAGVRNPDASQALTEISDQRLKIVKLDVESDDSIRNAFAEVNSVLGDAGLDILVNNAGLMVNYSTNGDIDRESFNRCLNVNTAGPVITSQVFLPLLRKSSSPKIVNISSMWASIAQNTDGSGSTGAMAYKVSKAALNQAGMCMAKDLLKDGIIVTQFCPGWVQTDMGGPHGQITADESAEALFCSIKNLTTQHSGYYFDRNLKKYNF